MKRTSKRGLTVAGLIAACLALAPAASRAGTATTTFAVTATVPTSCTISSTPMSFGNYSSGSATVVTSTSTLSANCALLTSYTISLSKGAASSFSPRTMTMSSGGTTYMLDYNLYTTVTDTNIWGDGTSGTSTVSGVGTGLTQSITVYGSIPAGQSVAVGSYSDSIVATITF